MGYSTEVYNTDVGVVRGRDYGVSFRFESRGRRGTVGEPPTCP